MNIKKIAFALLLIPTAIFAQTMQEMKPRNYSIELHNQNNLVLFQVTKAINPKDIALASFNTMKKNSFISSCIKNENVVKTETDYYMEGVRGDFGLDNGESNLNFTFKKVLDKKEVSLGDCNIEDLVVDEVDFIVNFPLLEYEQTIKTKLNQYKLIIKKVP